MTANHSIIDHLLQLRGDGIGVRVVDGKLGVNGEIDPRHRELLRLYKNEILALMAPAGSTVSSKSMELLSHEQRRLWFLFQMAGPTTRYNVVSAWRIFGRLNENALCAAISAIVERHSILRTIYRTDSSGNVCQLVLPSKDFRIASHNTSHFADDEREGALEDVLSVLKNHRFDLANELPICVTVVRESERQYVLVVNVHHIATDGHSSAVFHRECAAIYGAYADVFDNVPEVLSFQYVDYCRLQQKAERDGASKEGLRYWREQLAGSPERSRLEPDNALKSGTAGGIAARYTMALPTELSAQLSDVCKRLGMTPVMVFQAALALSLCKYTDTSDVVVATPVANRDGPEFANVIGLFVNTIALRTRIDFSEDIETFLVKSRELFMKGVLHSNVPFDRVVEELQLERNHSAPPLTQTLIVYRTRDDTVLALDGLRVESIPLDTQETKFDLTAIVTSTSQGHELCVEFDSGLYHRRTIELFSAHYSEVLRQLVTLRGTSLSCVSLMSESEKTKQLLSWNVEDPCYFSRRTVHAVFESHAKSNPDRVAVACDGMRLTYAELNAAADRLAGHLGHAGVQTGTPVGIHSARSVDNVIAVIGVLKAGGAYVPLDPAQPDERLRYMAVDSSLAWCLGRSDRPAWLPQDVEHIDLRTLGLMSSREVRRGTVPDVGPEDPAYVVYTSGSTGQPKGVILRHAGLVNLISNLSRLLQPDTDSTVCQFATPGFDAATGEYFMALGTGAALFIPSEHARLDPDRLSAECAAAAVTHVILPPALLPYLDPATFSASHVLTVGDSCSPGEASRWGASRIRFFNGYGPSEATCGATIGEYFGEGLFTIGRPLVNVQVTIRDRFGNLLPEGIPGELHIAGACVATGYLNGGEETNCSFRLLREPIAQGSHSYSTGDAARWLATGEIEFLGRIVSPGEFTSQVKIRGQRVELGEIESTLCALDGVRSAVVVCSRSEPGEPVLVAYVLVLPGAGSSQRAYRDALEKRLPSYMIPQAFVELQTFPLTISGKVDKTALPMPEAVLREDQEPPRTELEKSLCDIWASLLGRPRIGRSDNFFRLGGHSLMVVRLVARIREHLGFDVSIQLVFAYPTVAGLSAAIQGRGDSASPNAPVNAARPYRDGARISLAQQRLWFFAKMEATAAAYNMPMLWRLVGPLHLDALQAAFDSLVSRHEGLRTYFVETNMEVRQHVIPVPTGLPIKYIDLSNKDDCDAAVEVEVEKFVRRDTETPFDLCSAPLVRAVVWKAASNEHFFYLNVHHIVCDGASLAVMFRELRACYDGFLAGVPVQFEPLRTQYADYSEQQRNQLTKGTLERQLGFWRDALLGAPSLLTIPLESGRADTENHRGGRIAFGLPGPLVAAVSRVAADNSCTPFMVILAAWALLLSRLASQNEVVIGVPVTSRTAEDLEGIVGFFVNTLPIRVMVTGQKSAEELLSDARTSILDAYSNQDVPFDTIVEAVQPQRVIGRNPVFQALLNYTSGEEFDLSLSDVTVAKVTQPERMVHFDLALNVNERKLGTECSIVYATALINPESAFSYGRAFVQLLTTLVEDSKGKIGAFPLLDRSGVDALLHEFGNLPRGILKNGEAPLTFYELFHRQVALRPNATAVVCGNQSLTYGELHLRATRMACLLVASGVRLEDRVALLLPRSAEMLVAILGVMRVGGVYVPLDIDHPVERLNLLLGDCAARTLLTTAEDLGVGVTAGIRTVALDLIDWQSGMVGPVSLELHADDPYLPNSRNAAYVIYTSGSTGLPKGVVIEHHSLINFWKALREGCCRVLELGSRFAQNANYTFDASLKGIVQVLSGHELHMIPQDVRLDADAFIGFLKKSRIHAFDCTPPQLENLSVAGFFEHVQHLDLKLVLIGGAAFDQHLWRRMTEVRSVDFINMYGPTECTVDATMERVDDPARTPNIGRPLPNVSVYILDAFANPVPVGVLGEIYIGGEAVARGYLNRPELTAEKFLPDPFSARPDARMYRTGDLARWLNDGRIEYRGRNDFQVKIRGFRVELGEIEACLSDMDEIQDCVVIASEEHEGNARLVAYVVPDRSGLPDVDVLRARLDRKLPPYMIPAAFVALEKLPLNSNGKVDRAKLPSAGSLHVGTSRFEEPIGPIEKEVASVWQRLTRVTQVGRRDNFFEVGGHSLLAVRVVEALQGSFEVSIPLRELFAHPVMAAFSARISELLEGQVSSHLVCVRADGEHFPLFLIHPGEGEIRYAFDLASGIDSSIPIYAIAAIGLQAGEKPLRSIEAMAAQYCSWIRDVQSGGPYRLAGWSAGGMIAFEMARNLRSAGEEVEFVGLFDTAIDYAPLAAFGYGEDGRPAPDDEVRALLSMIASQSTDEESTELRATSSRDELYEYAHRREIIPSHLGRPAARRYLLMRDGMRNALVDYKVKKPPCRIDLFVAEDSTGRDLGSQWRERVGEQVVVHRASGNHLTMVERPQALALGEAVSQVLLSVCQGVRAPK